MNICVTGGAGFIGSHLCERLLKEGNNVLCLDNLFRGTKQNISHLLENNNFTFRQCDITHPLSNVARVDQIYHLASPCSPNTGKPKNIHVYPFETMLANTFGTWNLAELATRKRAKFLFASTSEVYGEPAIHPQPENYRGSVSTTGPRSIYDEAKRFGETITAAFVRTKKLDARIIRIFNTYGPGMDLEDGRVVVEFIVKALRNEPIPLFGDGKQTRSFCYVDDLVAGLIRAMNHNGTKGEIFNLGNPKEHTILELAKIIKHMTHSSSKIIFAKPLPLDDPTRRQPDITKAKRILHWQPKVAITEGLGYFISAVKNEKNLAANANIGNAKLADSAW